MHDSENKGYSYDLADLQRVANEMGCTVEELLQKYKASDLGVSFHAITNEQKPFDVDALKHFADAMRAKPMVPLAEGDTIIPQRYDGDDKPFGPFPDRFFECTTHHPGSIDELTQFQDPLYMTDTVNFFREFQENMREKIDEEMGISRSRMGMWPGMAMQPHVPDRVVIKQYEELIDKSRDKMAEMVSYLAAPSITVHESSLVCHRKWERRRYPRFKTKRTNKYYHNARFNFHWVDYEYTILNGRTLIVGPKTMQLLQKQFLKSILDITSDKNPHYKAHT